MQEQRGYNQATISEVRLSEKMNGGITDPDVDFFIEHYTSFDIKQFWCPVGHGTLLGGNVLPHE